MRPIINVIKVLFAAVAIIFVMGSVTGVRAQSPAWRLVRHHGYVCAMRGTVDRPQVLVHKGTDAGGHPFLAVKFRTPWLWGDTGTANVGLTEIDLGTGGRASQGSHCFYRRGWIYLLQYIFNDRTTYNWMATIYRDNDFGRSDGPSRTVDLRLNTLDPAKLPYSDKASETFW